MTSWARPSLSFRCADVRRSEFTRALENEFGARAAMIMADLSLPGVGNRTAAEAIDAGTPPREVWLALCAEMDVPAERWHGVGRLDPKH